MNNKNNTHWKAGHKVGKKEVLEDYKWFVTEIWNSLEDDLEIDKTGESGYKNEKECIKAIKKYTLPAIRKKAKQLGKMDGTKK